MEYGTLCRVIQRLSSSSTLTMTDCFSYKLLDTVSGAYSEVLNNIRARVIDAPTTLEEGPQLPGASVCRKLH